MSDRPDTAFPRRDADGRIVDIRDLLGMTLAGVVAAALALLLFDGLFAVIGSAQFGNINGWLAVILPTMLLVEEFRAWRPARGRVVLALVCVALGLGTGLLATGVTAGLPSLVSGTLGAAVFTVMYVLVWFYGVRTLAGRDR